MKPVQLCWLCLVTLLVLSGAACSSLPKTQPSQIRDFAEMRMQLAGEMQVQRNHQRAVQLFLQAYNDYTRVDDVKGKIDAGLSISRQYFYLGKPSKSNAWLKRVSPLILGKFAFMSVSKGLLLTEIAFEKGDYVKVIQIASALQSDNPLWMLELKSYLMIARFKVGMNVDPDLQSIGETLPGLYKKYRKNRLPDPGVLSLAYYYSAYIRIKQKQWGPALLDLERAREIDGTIDNSFGLAKDLMAMGQCYRELDSKPDAAQCYMRASEVYRLIGEIKMAEAALIKAEALK